MGLGVQRAMGIVLVLTVLLVLLRPHDPNVDFRAGWVMVGLVLGLGAAIGATLLARSRAARRLRRRGRGWSPAAVWGTATVASAIGGAAGVLLALPLRYSYGWDAAVTTGFSDRKSVV